MNAVENCNGEPNGIENCSKDLSYLPKIFCDPVHGQVALHPVCVAIIDTPQFQRLRHIKQTGHLEYVFPGATHNRFSHSLGVCHLAGKFLQQLKERQPELHISGKDILCVEIAGLCHDLGHGPFSHTWEKYMKTACKRRNLQTPWRHEMVSANMLDYLIEDNNLQPILEKYGVYAKDVNLIKDYIIGAQPKDPKRTFLHQIVNNHVSGLDVDKFDYFLRDCHYLGLKCNFEYERLMQFTKVFTVSEKSQICFRDKVLDDIYNVFRTRCNLHRLGYQHKISIVIQTMLVDALVNIDGKYSDLNGEMFDFFQWSMDAANAQGEKLHIALQKFTKMTDSLLLNCLQQPNGYDLRRSTSIMEAIEKRSTLSCGFYRHIGLKILRHSMAEDEIKDGLCEFLPEANETILQSCKIDALYESKFPLVIRKDISVQIIPVNWGKGNKNPVDFVHFYSKNSVLTHLSATRCEEVSAMLPKYFEEIQVHIICRRNDPFAFKVVRLCFEKFWESSDVECDIHGSQ